MCDHSPNREAAMVTIKPGVHCDPCLVPLIRALNDSDELPTVTSQRFGTELATIASCCGHGTWPGRITLADGRELFVLPDQEAAGRLSEMFWATSVEVEAQVTDDARMTPMWVDVIRAAKAEVRAALDEALRLHRLAIYAACDSGRALEREETGR